MILDVVLTIAWFIPVIVTSTMFPTYEESLQYGYERGLDPQQESARKNTPTSAYTNSQS